MSDDRFGSDIDELNARRMFMTREGYRLCDIAACNCNSWHGGPRERFERMLASGIPFSHSERPEGWRGLVELMFETPDKANAFAARVMDMRRHLGLSP